MFYMQKWQNKLPKFQLYPLGTVNDAQYVKFKFTYLK